MGKRNKVILLTKEAKMLKTLREKNGISLRKLSEKMRISFMRVHQMESGRENISEEYVNRFLHALALSRRDWEVALGPPKKNIGDLRERCHELLDTIPIARLELVFDFLVSNPKS